MTQLKSILLATAGMAALYGCGGGSDETTVVKASEPVKPLALEHVTIPNATLYKADYIQTNGAIDLTGLALKYQKVDERGVTRWSVWANNGVMATKWWVELSRDEILKDNPNSVQLTSISRQMNRPMADGRVPAELVIKRVDVSYNDIVHNTPQIKVSNPNISSKLNTELDFVSAGTSMYPKWSGKISLTELKTRAINTDNWHDNKGYSTDMLGDVETTRNGDKVTVTMTFPAAGCTLVGDATSSGKTNFDKLIFTGFDKCRFDLAKGVNWTAPDLFNNEGLAKGRNGAVAYGATLKNDSGAEMLLIGFPELDGVVLVMNKR